MTEEKAQDTLKVGIEELLEKEGKSIADVAAVVNRMRPEFVCERTEGTLRANMMHGGLLCVARGNGTGEAYIATEGEIRRFIKWLQDNFLPKGKKDDRQEDSKTPFEDA